MKKNPALKVAIIGGAASIMVIGALFFFSGDRVFGGMLFLAGIVEIVLLPVIIKRMEDMNR